jgi:hypothetical protein
MYMHQRSTRRLAAVFIPGWLGVAALLATGAAAQDAGPSSRPASVSEPRPYWLRVSADQVNLRSRADRNSLPVARLDRGQVLQAVGSEYGWHRIFPPEGVFSFVSARYVDQLSETEGIVSVSSGGLRVRVGSELNEVDPLRTEVQALLPRGAKVHIIGRRDEWLKIVPPEGVFFYVADECVERISPETAASLQPTATRPARPESDIAATRPAEGPDLSGPWGQRLSLVEAAIEAEGRKDALQQSWTKPIAELRPIAEQHADPAVARLAQRWISRLEQRIADQAALRAVRKLESEAERNQAQLDREMEQIRRARERAASPSELVARGQLRESFALRGGISPPYRLVDPITHAVVAYLEFPLVTDLKPAEYLGLYVGVAGEKRTDESFGADVIKVSRIEALLPRSPAIAPARTNP